MADFDRRKAAEIEPMAKAYLETFSEQEYDHEIGYSKKYFFVWKGENLYRHHDGTDLAWENIGRFRFVSVPGGSPKSFESVRRQGVVRILESKEIHPEDSLTQTYHRWLKKWLGAEKQVVLLQKDNNIDDGMFVLQPGAGRNAALLQHAGNDGLPAGQWPSGENDSPALRPPRGFRHRPGAHQLPQQRHPEDLFCGSRLPRRKRHLAGAYPF